MPSTPAAILAPRAFARSSNACIPTNRNRRRVAHPVGAEDSVAVLQEPSGPGSDVLAGTAVFRQVEAAGHKLGDLKYVREKQVATELNNIRKYEKHLRFKGLKVLEVLEI